MWEFFASAENILRLSLDGVELPDHIMDALAHSQPLDGIDRLCIYCDGNAGDRRVTQKKMVNGQGIHGHSEEYTHEGTPKINFVGWTAQPVLYESDALHHKRSFGVHWGGFLRITLCLLHSALIPVPPNSERQSAGLHEYVYAPPRQAPIDGSPEDSAKLSESFMLLESAVGLPYWDFSHVRGDSGDAINDVTPWRNKKRVKSFLLPRKDISSCRWRDSLSLSLSFSSG